MLRLMLSIGFVSASLFAPSAAVAQDQNQTPLDSPFLEEPKTPIDMFDAARISANLARPELAKRYIDQILATATPEQLLEIREKFGVGELLRMAGISKLQPSSRTLLQKSNEAFRAQAGDGDRIRGLIADLGASPAKSRVAQESLRAGGASSIPTMLEVLADDRESDRHAAVTVALSRMNKNAVPALVAGTYGSNDRVRSACLQALGYQQDRSVVPFLWYPAFAPNQPDGVRAAARKSLRMLLANDPDRPKQISNFGAADRLYLEALGYLEGTRSTDIDNDGQVTAWAWNGNSLASTQVSAEQHARMTGHRLARDAMELAPKDSKKQAIYLAFALAEDSRKAGWSAPLPTGAGSAQDLGLSVGPALLGETLQLALDADNLDAARGALAAIWQVGDRDLLRHPALRSSLSHPDNRIQLAAANAILNLNPPAGSPGGSQILSVLSRALQSGGVTKCVIIDPNAERANTTATLLVELGYAARTANTGRDGFRLAAEQGDVSLVVVHANSARWALSETIANLRADARTAGLPIVINGPAYVEARIQGMLKRYPRLTFLEESEEAGDASQKFVQLKLKPFLEMMAPKLTEEELAAQKVIAADWFAQLSGPRRSSPIDLSPAQKQLTDGARVDATASQCIVALGSIPTAGAQMDLYSLAADDTLAEGPRTAAINELTFHIQRNGALMGASEQVAAVKMAQALATSNLGNAAAALAGVLKPTIAQRFQRLRGYQPRR